ncbi:MAG: tetratricopeptide repeat protein [Kiritimatiellia bacterium]
MVKLSLTSIALLSLSLLCGCGSGAPESLLKKGLAGFEREDYSKAIHLLTKASKEIKNSEELYYTLGLSYLHLGDMDKALDALNKTLDLNPTHYESLICCGQIAYHKNELDSARKYYGLVLEMADDANKRAVLFTSMALAESGLKNKRTARLYLIRALDCDRSYAPAYYNLATLYRDKFGFLEEALHYFEKFIEFADEDDAHFDKAEKHIKRLRDNLARKDAKVKIKRDAEKAFKLLREGVVHQTEKNYRDAIKSYDAALRADPFAFSAAYGRAMAWQKLNNSREALKAFKKAVEINPDHRDSYARAVTIALQLKRYSEGLALLDKAIARTPDYPSWYDLMARILFGQEKYVEARKYGEHYISMLDPADADKAAYEEWVKSIPES